LGEPQNNNNPTEIINNNNNNTQEIGRRNSRKLVHEHEDVTVLWNYGVQTDRDVANRTDIMVRNKTASRPGRLLLDVAIPSDRYVTQKEAEKIKIYKFMYRNLPNVEYETLRHTNNHWGHVSCN
jgi:hypothetical protein